MEIKSLNKVHFDTIYKAFEQAFADYEMQLDKTQLQVMLKRRGFNPDLSFAAFDKDEVVAFTLNGIGHFNGVPTAYDTGTGTLKQYRGKGLATKIFEYSIPYLKAANIKQYLLEVLQYNTKAVSVYSKLGFEVTREFNYFVQESQAIRNKVKTMDFSHSIRMINVNEYAFVSDFWDFQPSWQNNIESINRASEDFVSLGVFTEDKLVGYCVFEPSSGDITQIAVDHYNRRKGIASLLLREVIQLNKNVSIKIINTDIRCSSVTSFLKAKNIDIKGKQFEMTKNLVSTVYT